MDWEFKGEVGKKKFSDSRESVTGRPPAFLFRGAHDANLPGVLGRMG